MKSYKEKKNWKDKINLHRVFPALLFTLTAACFFFLFASYTRTSGTDLSLTPLLSDNRGWELYACRDDAAVVPLTPEEFFESEENTLYLSRTLPVSWEEEGYTMLCLDQQWSYAVFLDEALIYSNVPGFTGEPGSVRFPDGAVTPVREEPLLVSLPAGYGGKQLTIAVRRQPRCAVSVFLTSRMIEQESIAVMSSRQLMPGIFFGVLVLILFALLLPGLGRRNFQLSLLLLLLSSLFEMLGFLNDLNMYLPTKTFFDTPLTGFIQPFFVHFPLFFFLTQMKKYRRVYAPFVIFSFASTLITPALNLFGIQQSLTPWFWLPFQLFLPLFLLFSVLEMQSGNDDFRFLVKSLLLFFLALIVSLIFSGGGQNSVREHVRIMLLPVWDIGVPTLLIFWCGTFLLLFGLVFSARRLLLSYISLRTEKEMLLLKTHLAEQNLASIKKNSRQLAEARHNFSHHLNVLSGLAHADNIEELKDYLTRLTEDTARIAPLTLTAHPAVNAVVTNAMGRADQSGIKMDCNIILPPALSVPDIDLCNYLMNLLDNALNAQKNVAEKKRWISLSMYIRENHLYIEASNALAQRVSIDKTSGLCISEKGEGHGYGMKTMQDIATRYHSALSIEVMEDSIRIRTAFLIPL